MATITKSIGTDSRDYSTFRTWADDLDDATIYADDDTAVGEMYNDDVHELSGRFLFSNQGTNIGGTGAELTEARLTVPTGERHDGTAGTGTRISQDGATGGRIEISYGGDHIRHSVEWCEVNAGGSGEVFIIGNFGGSWEWHGKIDHLLCHNYEFTTTAPIVTFNSRSGELTNSIFYDITSSNSTRLRVIQCGSYYALFANNTIFGATNSATASAEVYGIHLDVNAGAQGNTAVCYNNIVVGTTSTGSGATVADFYFDGSNLTQSNNLSSDTSAASTSGGGSGDDAVTGVSASNLFVSTVGGSEDLHLKAGADAIGGAKDLGTGYAMEGESYGSYGTTLNMDIDNYNRNDDDNWDIGADQFVASAAAQTGKSFLLFMD